MIYKSSVLLSFLFSYTAIQAQCNLSIDVPDDITICDPQNINLTGSISGNYLDFFGKGIMGSLIILILTPRTFHRLQRHIPSVQELKVT